jgi:hypothetical protein
MRRIRSFLRRHRLLVGSASAVALGLAIFVLIWFQPQKLFIDKTVDDAAPVAVVDLMAGASATANPSAAARSRPSSTPGTAQTSTLISRRQFISRGHHTSGTALLYRLPDGSHLLRFESLDTSNGPDLRVYLSPASPNAPNDSLNDQALNIAHLKGNRGNQNYAIAAGVDVSSFNSVVIWCKRFSYAFGAASLS